MHRTFIHEHGNTPVHAYARIHSFTHAATPPHLRGHDGEDLDGDPVEFVEAAPGAGLREPAEDVAHRLKGWRVC